ncbi:MAG TPA: hypothetical protein VMU50_15375 [Polyangia bacterium]|nr:hypothetical protein [Polyangia bacterium]
MDVKPGTPKQAKLNFYIQKKPQAASPEPANVNNGVEERERPASEAVVAGESPLEDVE